MRSYQVCGALLASATLVCAISPLSRAQQPVQLPAGQGVRVTAPAAGLKGEQAFLLAATTDTIFIGRTQLRSDSGSWHVDTVRTAVPIASLTSLEVKVGRRSHTLAYGAGGAAVGALTFFLGVKAAEKDQCGWNDYFCIDKATAPASERQALIVGGLLGAAVGAILGAHAGTERWEQVPFGAGVAVVPLSGGRLGFGANAALGGSPSGAGVNRPHGLWLSAGLAIGGAVFGYSWGGKTLSGLSGTLQAGTTVSHHVSLAAEASAWSSAARGTWEHIEALCAVALLYPSERSGFFLKGGVGAFIPGTEDAARASPGLVVGLGLDLARKPGFSFRPYASYVASTERQAIGGTTGSVRLSMFQVGLAGVWR